MKGNAGKRIIHDALILTAFTLVLGFILGAVHEITKERIEAAELAAEQAAYIAVFEDAAGFEDTSLAVEELDQFLADAGYKDKIKSVKVATDAAGNVLGYVINVTATDGSQDTITFSVGVRADRTVNGYSITDIAETPGLGSKADEESFYSQFRDKAVDFFEVVKQTPAADSQIEAITGATITSRAMANGVNAALVIFDEYLADGDGASL